MPLENMYVKNCVMSNGIFQSLRKLSQPKHQWLTLVILATWEAEIGRIMV
jgi:hypothetical protein